MAYFAFLYYDTGFNAVNIPDSAELLSDMTHKKFPALEILDSNSLGSVRLKVSGPTDVSDADYLLLGSDTAAERDFYYFASSYRMLSSDVAELFLVPDYITTYGLKNLDFLDGITERHTTADDTMLKYTQADELCSPQQPLHFKSGGMLWGKEKNTGFSDHILVESTVDLLAMQTNTQVGLTLKSNSPISPADAENPEYAYSVYPWTKGVVGRTVYKYGTDSEGKFAYAPHTRQYDAGVSGIADALGIVRALATEGAIISQVVYPHEYFEEYSDDTVTSNPPGAIRVGSDGQVLQIRSMPVEKSSGLKLDAPYAKATDGNPAVKNKRLLYGEYNRYGIMTASGETGEYLPEQILTSQKTDAEPKVTCVVDPRPSGKPYFRFSEYLNTDTRDDMKNSELIDGMNGCVSGMSWANAPLVYTQASGSYMTTRKFQNAYAKETSTYNFLQEQNRQKKISALYDSAEALLPFAGREGNESVSPSLGMARGLTNSLNAYDNAKYSESYTKAQYENARAMEEAQYNFSMNVVTPDVLFPFNADFIRDFCGNGAYVYRYFYAPEDVTRIDRLLTMYGYKDTKKLENSDFSNRKYFDYVRASGVSLKGKTGVKVPLRVRNAIVAQLSVGVRVWHVAPDVKYYSSGNPIK